MEALVIQRRGSFLYTRAYRKLAVALTLIYLVIGMLLALVAGYAFSTVLAGIAIFLLVSGFVAALWIFYLSMLWLFSREARQTVEVGRDGVREMRDGREHAFIPWEGITEIELAATIVAGASLRVKGNFSEIGISNVDLMLEPSMTLREMHRAVGQTHKISELLDTLKVAAPHASLRMNKLARRRLSKYEWVRSL
jgi:uncharacterized protein (DUF58 family)